MSSNPGLGHFCSIPSSETKRKAEASWHQISKIQYQYGIYLISRLKIAAPYVSVWDGGIEIETTAVINIRTGEVTNIRQANVNGFDICEREYVVMNGAQVDVYQDDHGFEYWADIQDEYGTQPETGEATSKCLNGKLQAGDLVISTPSDEYSCLIGRVLNINLLGSFEHEQETDNETDDVHVNFLEYDYSDKRIKEIEEMFSDLYGEEKPFDECPIDDTIMAPECLIRITGMDHDRILTLLDSGYNAACYCYGILERLAEHSGSDSSALQTTQTEVEVQLSDVIESSLALSGFEVMDGGRGYFIVRHSESDTDFEIKVGEIPC